MAIFKQDAPDLAVPIYFFCDQNSFLSLYHTIMMQHE